MQVHAQLEDVRHAEVWLERRVEDPVGRRLAGERRRAAAGEHGIEVRLEADLAGRGRLGVVDLDLERVLRASRSRQSCHRDEGEQEGAHGRDRMRPRRPRRARATFGWWPTR